MKSNYILRRSVWQVHCLWAMTLALGLTPFEVRSQPNPRPFADFWFADGPVNAILITNETIYLGGNFNYVGPQTGPLAAYDTTAGAPLRAPQVMGAIYAVVPDGTGGWFIGGQFTRVENTCRTNLARLCPDLSLDTTWDANIVGQGVYCLHLADGKLYVGGQFSQISGVRQPSLAALDSANASLLPWNPAASGTINCMARIDDTLYVAGSFSRMGNSNRNNLASLSISTGQTTAWNPNADGGQVLALALAGNTAYVGGQFTSVGGKPRNRLAALDVTTGTAATWNPNPNGLVRALAVSESAVYVAGDFTTISVQNRQSFAAINRASGAALELNPRFEGPSQRMVRYLWLDGSVLYIAGSFQRLEGVRHPLLAAIDLSTGQWIADHTIPMATDYNGAAHDACLNTVAIVEGRMMLGGDLQSVGGAVRHNAAALSAINGTLLPWSITPSHPVDSLAFSRDKVYVGGAFTNLNGTPASALAAVDPITGQRDPAFAFAATNLNGTPTVNCLLPVDTNLFVGGIFTGVGEKSVKMLAMVDADSGAVMDFDAKLSGGSEGVVAIAKDGETLYVGGDFTTIGGKSRSRLAAVGASDGALLDWAPTPNNRILTLAISGNRLYVGGLFTKIGTIDLRNLAVFEIPSRTLLPFDATLQSSASGVNAIAASETCVFVAGEFESIGGEFRKNMAALGAFTAQAFEWNPAPSAAPQAIAATTDFVCLGGSFRRMSVSGQSAIPLGYFAVFSQAPWILSTGLSSGKLVFETTTGDRLRTLLQASSDLKTWATIATNDAPGYHWTIEQPVEGANINRFFRLLAE